MINPLDTHPTVESPSRQFQVQGAPWVTFLMPVYNGMNFIKVALDSVLAQTKVPWKLLIVDDGSTDGTWEYVQNLATAQIRVERNLSNKGLYGTLNERVHEIETPWTSIIFQDDRLMPDYLEGMQEISILYPGSSLIWAAINIIDPRGRVTHTGISSHRKEEIQPGVEAWRSILLRGTIWTISGSFSKTSTLQKFGFRSDLPHLGDYDFLLRTIRVEKYIYFEKVLSEFRDHMKQASAGNLSSGRDIEERLKVISEQLSTCPSDVNLGFRLEIMHRLAKVIALRGLGAIRRRKWNLAAFCFCNLPAVYSTCFPPAAIQKQAVRQ